MLTHIKTLEELEEEALIIDGFLNTTCSEDPNEAIERGNDLLVYLARTGKMLADAEKHLNDKVNINTVLVHETYNSMSPSIQKKLIESMCQKEMYMYTWTERLHRTCVHQLDFIRTMISKAKEEMRLQR